MTKHSPVSAPKIAELSPEVADILDGILNRRLSSIVVTPEMVGRTILHEGTLIFADRSFPGMKTASFADVPAKPCIPEVGVEAPRRLHLADCEGQAPACKPLRADRLAKVLAILRDRADDWTAISQIAPQLAASMPDLKDLTRNGLHMITKRAADGLVKEGLVKREQQADEKHRDIWVYKLIS